MRYFFKVTKLVIYVLFLLTFSTSAIAGNAYYVSPTGNDNNDGSISSPWRTITYAISQSGPGDTIYLRGGTHSEGASPWIRADRGHGGANGQFLTIEAYPGETPIINHNYAFWRINADYVRIKGLRFNLAVWFDGAGANNLQILDNYFVTGASFGAVHGHGDDIRIEGNIIELTDAQNSTLDHGIYTARGRDIIIRNNIIKNSYGYGIHIFDEAPGAVIENVLIEGNYVSGSRARSGILVAGTPDIHNLTIRNNVITANNHIGIVINEGQNIMIYNNTIVENGRQGIKIGEYDGKIIQDIYIRNNIIDQSPNSNCSVSCSWYDIALIDARRGQNVVVDNNLYWPTDIGNLGVTDANAIIDDPLFVDSNNNKFHLQENSPAIDAGVDVGLSFIGSAPDLGALEFGDTTTNVNESGNQPTKFKLYQNYPNPFNPETQIIYELVTTARVTLTIFDLIGYKVKTLVNEEKSKGTYEVIWNGKNTRGENVASGIYFYNIEVLNKNTEKLYSRTKKMILLH